MPVLPAMPSTRSHLRTLHNWITIWGINPTTTFSTLRGLPFYFRDLAVLWRQSRQSARPFPLGPPFLCVGERFSDSGTAKGHYFHQDLLVASRIHQNKPERHIDVGSRIDGFVAHVASFRPIEVLDIRRLSSSVPNIRFLQGDLMAALAPQLQECTDSLSCLHALEHFGLGRYGDPVDYDGYLKGLANLVKMLRPRGKFYLSVPIGPQRIEFNAHRVFAVKTLLELVQPTLLLDSLAFVDDDGALHEQPDMSESRIEANFDCRYGCCILELTKRAT